jgi:hypothetical protein
MQRALLDALASHVRMVTCHKGAVVMREGEVGEHMYIIITGSCTVIKADREFPLSQRKHMRNCNWQNSVDAARHAQTCTHDSCQSCNACAS